MRHKFATHASTAKFLKKWHERESWGDIARSLLGIQRNAPYDDDEQKHEVKRLASLLSAQARGATRSDEVVRLLGYEPRKTKHFVVAFHFEDPDTAAALRRAIDALGSRRDVGKAIASGRIRLEDCDE